jgi:hypothetical protein
LASIHAPAPLSLRTNDRTVRLALFSSAGLSARVKSLTSTTASPRCGVGRREEKTLMTAMSSAGRNSNSPP